MHLLRHVRGGLPRGRDLPREGLRALGLPARRLHLYEGRAGGPDGEVRLPAEALILRPGPAAAGSAARATPSPRATRLPVLPPRVGPASRRRRGSGGSLGAGTTGAGA